jgi:hypothetical protein
MADQQNAEEVIEAEVVEDGAEGESEKGMSVKVPTYHN